MATRIVKLVHLSDGGIRSFVDDGCDGDGHPGGMRQQLMNALAKMVPVRDQSGQVVLDEEGFAVEWPCFKLAEPPKPVPYNMADPKQAKCARADKFDRDVLRVDGQWKLATPAWLEHAEGLRGARAVQTAEFKAIAERQLQNEAGAVLQELLALARERPKPAAPAKREKGGGHGEAQA